MSQLLRLRVLIVEINRGRKGVHPTQSVAGDGEDEALTGVGLDDVVPVVGLLLALVLRSLKVSNSI